MSTLFSRVPNVNNPIYFVNPVVYCDCATTNKNYNYRLAGCSNSLNQLFLVTGQRNHCPVLELTFMNSRNYNSDITLVCRSNSFFYFCFPTVSNINVPDEFKMCI